MYRLTEATSQLHAHGSPAQNFSRPQRMRSPAPENARRPRSPAMVISDDPMTWGAPDIQKSQPIRYAGSAPTTALGSHASRRPTDRSARSLSPLRTERSPPAHIRAQTPPLPCNKGGFLAPPGECDDQPVSLRTPPRSPLCGLDQQETRGRDSKRSGLREGMTPGPKFFEQASRRTRPSRLLAHPSSPELATSRSTSQSPPAVELPVTPTPTPKNRRPTLTLKSRKSTPSMHDYMTLEQLETLWSSADLTGGLVEAPPIQAPRFTMEQILEARRQMGDIGVHPALRGSSQAVN